MFRNYIKYCIAFFFTCGLIQGMSQEGGSFYGAFQSNSNFFIRDSVIGAANIPQYDNQKFGTEAWLNLNYSYKTLTVGMRYDLFLNSNLLDPNGSYTDQGIGMWYAELRLNKLDLRAGYIYDQIGSGLIFRSYQIRPLLIDNALYGVKADYHINKNWSVKGFAGQQKNLFDRHRAVIKGGSIDGFMSFGEEKPLNIIPGFGIVSRTLTDESVQRLSDILRNYHGEDRIEKFNYNNYLFSLYNTLSYGGFNWYAEAAYKSKDVFLDPNAIRTFINGTQTQSRYVFESGTSFYSSLSYSQKGLGITVEGRRTENFNFRTDQTLTRNVGLINFIPPLIRQNTYRLTARYSPAIQDISEMGIQADVRYKFSKALSGLVNYSNIRELDGNQLYQELYTQFLYKYKRKWRLTAGVQLQQYNQAIYEGKPIDQTPDVMTVTPFAEFLYNFTRKKSIRLEAQYMSTEQDYGSWIFGFAEIGFAPHWQFEVSGMYNIIPSVDNPNIPESGQNKKILYPTLGAVYTRSSNRYSLKYVKQVEGIVCSGGVCRLEPAFSGFKFEIGSTF